jgi:hypothetical protein
MGFKGKLIISAVLIALTGLSSKCKKTQEEEEFVVRDRKEQYQKEKDSILHFIQSHTYIVDAYNNIYIEPITHAGQRSIYDDALLVQMQDTAVEDLIYDVYFLRVHEGTQDSITTADGILLAFEIQDFELNVINRKTELYPHWTNVWLPNLGIGALGLRKVLPEFKAGIYTANNDGTVYFSEYGVGAVFLPSGLANYQFAVTSPGGEFSNLPPYSPVIVKFKTLAVNTDFDQDNVPNILEDLNGNGDPTDDNTDKELEEENNLPEFPNYRDADDDGDGLPTKTKIPTATVIPPMMTTTATVFRTIWIKTPIKFPTNEQGHIHSHYRTQ